jgi:DNA-binding response OmpR family regulator
LRSKIAGFEDIIRTIRGGGYRFDSHPDVHVEDYQI